MCLNLQRVPNPFKDGRYAFKNGKSVRTSDTLRSMRDFIEVPCGKCTECLNRRYSDLMQRVYVESLTSYVYMVTLTYNDDHIPRMSFSSTQDIEKYSIYFADFKHLQDMFKRIRDEYIFSTRDFRYLAVTEYGTEKMRPHFHLILFVGKKDSDPALYGDILVPSLTALFKKHFSVNVGTRKFPIYEPLFTDVTLFDNGVPRSTFDLHLVKPKDKDGHLSDGDSYLAASAVSSYVLSYVNKINRFEEYISKSFPMFEDLYGSSVMRKLRNLLQCRCSYSHQLGFGFDSDGRKVVPHRDIPTIVSPLLVQRFELYSSLPDDELEFSQAFPELYEQYVTWQDDILSRRVPSYIEDLRTFLLFNFHDVDMFVIALKYHPHLVTAFCSRNHFDSSGCYLLSSDIFSSSSPGSSNFYDSLSYKYISDAVNLSLTSSFKSFVLPILDSRGYKYVPMCSYYKSYFVSDDHTLRLYQKLRVRNYDEYVDLLRSDPDFTRAQVDNSVANYNTDRRIKYYSSVDKNPNLFVSSNKISIFALEGKFLTDRCYEESSASQAVLYPDVPLRSPVVRRYNSLMRLFRRELYPRKKSASVAPTLSLPHH